MILIGQFDSPFVRRVGIALRSYGLLFEHRPWSVWRDADQIAAHNPLRRVPVLVLDSGLSLMDSGIILDFLDQQVAEPARLLSAHAPARTEQQRIIALSTGLADKAVSLFYERTLHAQASGKWVERCHAQIRDTLRVLETERAGLEAAFWLGEQPGHADIALACALRFLGEVHGQDLASFPALLAHAARCEALPVFQEISQPFSI